jgi:TonB family protein
MTDRKLLSGSLRRVSLADVFNLLGGNNFSGILNLRSQYTEYMGIIYFKNGNPINGYCGDLKGLDAIYALFGWTDGNYEFYEQSLTQIETVIKQGRMQIVLNALRMLDDGEITKIGPMVPQATEKKMPQVEEKKVVQPIEDSSEHICAGCKSLLFANDTKVFIGEKEYCFQCAMIRAHSMDGGSHEAPSKKKISVDDSLKTEPQKVAVFKSRDIKEDNSAKIIAPKDNGPKDDTLKAVSSKDNKLENIGSKIAASKVLNLKDTSSSDMDVSTEDKSPKNNTSAINKQQSDFISKLRQMGPFKISVAASMIMVWVVLGVILIQKFNSPSQNLVPVSQVKSPSSTVASTATAEQVKTTQVAVPITAGADSQNTTSSQPVKVAQTQDNKPVQSASSTNTQNRQTSPSVQTAAPQSVETKPAPAPIEKPTEKAEKPVNVAAANHEIPAEKSDASKTAVKETEETHTAVAKNEVKETAPEPAKAVVESKPVEKTEAPKLATPAPAAPAVSETAKQTVTKPAEFPGGKSALSKWLSSNVTFPEYAAGKGTEGYVVVELTIDPPSGKISKATIVQSLQKHCDQEVLRVVSKMPNWKPAEKNGVMVSSTYMLSVKFAQ